jgi:hypothetical protein
MNASNALFTPGTDFNNNIFVNLHKSVQNAGLKSVTIAGIFNTITKTNEVFEKYEFMYIFPKDDLSPVKIINNHMQDEDSEPISREENNRREELERAKQKLFLGELKQATAENKVKTVYKFFFEVARDILQVTHIRALDITVVDRNNLNHEFYISGNYAL